MDFIWIAVIGAVLVLGVIPVVFRVSGGLDRKADKLQGRDPEAARALREARRDIDRGHFYRGP